MLVRVGWRFHRIWNTDWWNHREAEVRRAVEAYNREVRDMDSGAVPSTLESNGSLATEIIEDQTLSIPERQGGPPSFAKGLKIDEYHIETLVALVRHIESDGRLRTNDPIITDDGCRTGVFEKRAQDRENSAAGDPDCSLPKESPRDSASGSENLRGWRRRADPYGPIFIADGPVAQLVRAADS